MKHSDLASEMLRLLKWSQGVGRCKATSTTCLMKQLLQQDGQTLRLHHLHDQGLRNHRFPVKEMNTLSSVRLTNHGIVNTARFDSRESNRTKTYSYFTSRTRQAHRLLGLQVGVRCQDSSSCPAVNVTCFHTSSHLKGKGSDFVKGLREAPLPALTLGLSGLIPFVVPALYTATTFTIGPNILWAQVAYGASILSFLGGIRWGFALTDGQSGPTWASLGYSVVPSLIAWLGLLMPLQASQVCVMSGLFMAWAADMSFKAYPAWFKSLRLVLSLVALVSIGVSYGFCLVYEPTSQAHGSNVVKLIKIVQIILED